MNKNRIAIVFSCATLIASVLPAYGAEEELTLLTITGDLIGELESIQGIENPNVIITAYYAELSGEARAELVALRRRMDRRLEDYQVAYTAADTAEINETLDDLSFYWASMRTIHAQKFTEAAFQQLSAAYGELFEFIKEAE